MLYYFQLERNFLPLMMGTHYSIQIPFLWIGNCFTYIIITYYRCGITELYRRMINVEMTNNILLNILSLLCWTFWMWSYWRWKIILVTFMSISNYELRFRCFLRIVERYSILRQLYIRGKFTSWFIHSEEN